MYYASFGILSLVLTLIINYEFIFNVKERVKSQAARRYRFFLFSVMAYYVSDILWGFLYGEHLIPLAYADTVLYFFTMVVSVLLWARFVVSYLDTQDSFAGFLTYAGWTVFLFEVMCLIINIFRPIIFEFNTNQEYIPGFVRYITLIMQVVLFLLASLRTIIHAAKAEGKERIRNKTVGACGIVMSVFIVLQTLYAFLPYYAIGLLIGTCLIHIFVEEDRKLDQAIELDEIQKQAEIEHQEKMMAKKKNITFNRIAESLALNYDMIYYVDTRDDSYVGYASNDSYGKLELKRAGDDFYKDSRADLSKTTFPDDKERVMSFIDRDYLLTTLEKRKQCSLDYRLLLDGVPQYTRVVVRKSSSGEHFIVAIENIDEEVIRERKQLQALNTEKELARRDELTGTKNKTAYAELEESVQENLDKGIDYLPFAIAVCDINDLKTINDTEGHKAGDEYICAASKLLCDIFAHSPVFRIGGDEFVVFLRGEDYTAREELLGRLRVKIFENLVQKNGPVIAIGVAAFEQGTDKRMSDVFERADGMMYEDKRTLKEQG
ncbi:MAG: GGDEF domain-containing protein [Eubacterium sp.]|nr:GGDEF domain-containing protein [Eubacterium sp.]